MTDDAPDNAASDTLDAVLARWRLEPATAIERPVAGTMNDTFIVTTARRRVVLRLHRRTDPALVGREHEVIAHAGRRGVPSPTALRTPDGDLIVDHAGRLYSLFTHARGQQVRRDELGPDHAGAMGRMLARIQHALADLPAAGDESPPLDIPTTEGTLRRIRSLVDTIERRPEAGEQEQWALRRLRTRAEWLESGNEVDRPDDPGEPVQMVHGDYQESNLFFAAGDVVGVIDWDKAEARRPSVEVVRALDLALGLDGSLCRAFLAGYRAGRPLSTAFLDTAAAEYGFWRQHDLWLYDTIYRRGDDRARRFVRPGPFVPFMKRWGSARAGFA